MRKLSMRVDPGQTEYEMPLATPGQRQKKDVKVGRSFSEQCWYCSYKHFKVDFGKNRRLNAG